MGTKQLKKCQYGKETIHGTAVAADTMLLCKVSLPETDREVHVPEVEVGVRTPQLLAAANVRRVLAEGTLEDIDGAYFELLPLLFSMGIKGNVTAVEQTPSEGDYLWQFPAPQTGAESVDSITLEAADDQQAYEIAYCLGKRIRITGDVDTGEVHVSVEFFGDKQIPTTVTGGLSVPTVELMNAKLSRIYIDGTWAGLGTTELQKALVSYEIVIEDGVHPKFFGSSQREFDSHGQGAITAEATFTFERTADVATEEQKYRPASGFAQTPRFIQLTITGDQIGSGDNQKLQIDLAGLWMSWSSLDGDRDDNTLDVAKLRAGYDSTGAQAINAEVTTTISTI